MTELSDVSGGRVVVETRWVAEARAERRWETTICPADDSTVRRTNVIVWVGEALVALR